MLQPIQITKIIPGYQFGFCQKHSTIQQCHHIARVISEALEEKSNVWQCFLDVSQPFDKY